MITSNLPQPDVYAEDITSKSVFPNFSPRVRTIIVRNVIRKKSTLSFLSERVEQPIPPSEDSGTIKAIPEVVGVEQKQPEWLNPTVKAMHDLLSLPEDWDSYGAGPVDPQCITLAIGLLLEIMQTGTPIPLVIPTVKGGFQLEWHTNGIDLEIEIEPSGRSYAFFEDLREGSIWEGETTRNPAPLVEFLSKLPHRN